MYMFILQIVESESEQKRVEITGISGHQCEHMVKLSLLNPNGVERVEIEKSLLCSEIGIPSDKQIDQLRRYIPIFATVTTVGQIVQDISIDSVTPVVEEEEREEDDTFYTGLDKEEEEEEMEEGQLTEDQLLEDDEVIQEEGDDEQVIAHNQEAEEELVQDE